MRLIPGKLYKVIKEFKHAEEGKPQSDPPNYLTVFKRKNEVVLFIEYSIVTHYGINKKESVFLEREQRMVSVDWKLDDSPETYLKEIKL